VLLSCGFLAHAVEDVLDDEHEGMQLRYVHEDSPLGTAGPMRLAADEGLLAERLLVLNGDVLTDMDLTAQLAFHDERGAKATLALIAVDDTSSYGVVPTNDDGSVIEFREKQPGPAPTNRINAGAYVLERDVVELIPAGRSVSFEREVFPVLVDNGLYGFHQEGYWIDIGTPERYLESTYDLLAGRVGSTLPPRDETGSLIYEPALTSGAHIGPQAVLGPHCSVGTGSTVDRSVLHQRVTVGSDCTIQASVLAEGVRVGDGAQIGPNAMLGSGAVVEAGEVVEPGARVEPGERVP
jgi:mannose-1-phosphate guanylyltransferase